MDQTFRVFKQAMNVIRFLFAKLNSISFPTQLFRDEQRSAKPGKRIENNLSLSESREPTHVNRLSTK